MSKSTFFKSIGSSLDNVIDSACQEVDHIKSKVQQQVVAELLAISTAKQAYRKAKEAMSPEVKEEAQHDV